MIELQLNQNLGRMVLEMLKNTYLISLTKKFLTVLFGMVSVIFLNRYLGPDLKGEYTYIINILSIVVVVLGLGISTIYPYYRRRYGSLYFSIFRNLVLIQFVAYVIFGIAVSLVINNQTVNLLCWLVPITILSTEIGYINLVENFKANAIIAIVSAFVNVLLLLLAFLLLDKNIIVALVIYAIKEAVIIIFTIATMFLKKDIGEQKKMSHKEAYKVIASGLIPMLTNLLIVINYRVDVVMLKWQNVDFYLIGLYSVGVSLAEYAWIVPDIFKEVIINKTAQNDSLKDVKFSLRNSSAILFVVFIGIVLVGKPFIVLLFGEAYRDSYFVTVIIFTGIYSMMYCKIIGALFISQGRQKFYFSVLFIGTSSNVVANYFIIPIWDIKGAAIASTFSYSVIGIIMLVSFLKRNDVTLKEVLFTTKEDVEVFKTKAIELKTKLKV